jgi:hypothetical protein
VSHFDAAPSRLPLRNRKVNAIVANTRQVTDNHFSYVASAPKISRADDREMDKSASKARPAPPGVSIRNGPVVDDRMDVDSTPNGASKRKSRSSIGQAVKYKEESDSDDGAPLVGWPARTPEFSKTDLG